MQKIIIATLVFLAASLYVIIFDQFAASTRAVQKAIVLPIILFLIGVLFFSYHASFKKLLNNQSRWLFLFLCTIFIQLLVISTGGIKSPLFILIYLFMVGTSLFFSFFISLLFLLSSLVVITSTLLLNQSLMPLLTTNPTPLVLQLASFVPIVAISYIVAKHYHHKDTLFKKLNTKILTQEAILESLNELIIITDSKLHILSLNDSAAQALQRSRSELLDKPIFDVLLLKDKNGKLMTNDTFTPQKFTDEYTLIRSSLPQPNIRLHVHPIQGLDDRITQISFVLSYPQSVTSKNLPISFEKTRTKYEALTEDLKKTLFLQGKSDLGKQILLLQKIENDIFETQTLQSHTDNPTTSKVDVAQLVMQATHLEQEFANALHVPLTFAVKNFGQKDIQPFITKNFSVNPEQFTGPFFTVATDSKQLEFVIKKLLDLGLLLASSETNPKVEVSIEREKDDKLLLQMTVTNSKLNHENIISLFIPYYDKLAAETNLHNGSGLEGYLMKYLCGQLGITVESIYKEDTTTLSIILHIPKSADKSKFFPS